METLKPHDTLPNVLCAPEPHRDILRFVEGQYGTHVILTGIKDESREDVYSRQFTFGIPLKKLCEKNGMDLLDYAQNTVVIYASGHLKKTPNGDYEVRNPYEAVLGFLELSW